MWPTEKVCWEWFWTTSVTVFFSLSLSLFHANRRFQIWIVLLILLSSSTSKLLLLFSQPPMLLCCVLFCFVQSLKNWEWEKNCISALCHRESHSSGGFYLLKRSEISRFVSPPMISGVSWVFFPIASRNILFSFFDKRWPGIWRRKKKPSRFLSPRWTFSVFGDAQSRSWRFRSHQESRCSSNNVWSSEASGKCPPLKTVGQRLFSYLLV